MTRREGREKKNYPIVSEAALFSMSVNRSIDLGVVGGNTPDPLKSYSPRIQYGCNCKIYEHSTGYFLNTASIRDNKTIFTVSTSPFFLCAVALYVKKDRNSKG